MTLFLLALYWFANQAGYAAKTSAEMSVSNQVNGVARTLATLVNDACSRRQEISYALPAITDGRAPVAYRANFSSNALAVYTEDYYPQKSAFAHAACAAEPAGFDGGLQVCINATSPSALIKVTAGGCA